MTVSGVTITSTCFHRDHNRRVTSQNSLSKVPILGLERRRLKTSTADAGPGSPTTNCDGMKKDGEMIQAEASTGAHGHPLYIRASSERVVLSYCFDGGSDFWRGTP